MEAAGIEPANDSDRKATPDGSAPPLGESEPPRQAAHREAPRLVEEGEG
jgi:hypothetical protein